MTETKELKPLPKVQAGGIIRKSTDQTWMTPQRILDCARTYFGGPIPLDPASSAGNWTQATRYFCGPEPKFTPACEGVDGDELARAKRDGLTQPWDAPVWCNPPYGAELKHWLAKMRTEAERGTPIIAMLPAARWEVGYMQDFMKAVRVICWHKGRVKFISSADMKPVSGNPFASMIVGLSVDPMQFAEAFRPLGPCAVLHTMPRQLPATRSDP